MKPIILIGIFGIIAFATIITVNFSYSKDIPHIQDNLFPYEVQYDDLVSRFVTVSAKVPLEKFSENDICFNVSNNEYSSLPNELQKAMANAKNNINDLKIRQDSQNMYNSDDSVQYYDGWGTRMPSEKALTFLQKYDSFQVKQNMVRQNLQNLTDTSYHFTCNIRYQNTDYTLTFDFISHYLDSGKITFVNFTKNGNQKIEGKDATTYQGFNSTVVFENKLDHDIILVNDGPNLKKGSQIVDREILIPKGKKWSFIFNVDRFESNADLNKNNMSKAVFKYHTEPDNLKGTLTVKLYPACMTENEIRSLYSEVMVYPRFPSHLPTGYSFECGIQHTYWSVLLVYLDDEGRQKMSEASEPVSHFAKSTLIDSGALIISYENGYAANNWQHNPQYDKYKSQHRESGFQDNMLLTVAGEPAVLYPGYFPNRTYVNTLEIFLDDSITYTIMGNFTNDELVSIGKSLFMD